MNETYEVLVYGDAINLVDGDTRTIKTNGDVLLNACKDIGFRRKHRKNKVYGSRISSRHDCKGA